MWIIYGVYKRAIVGTTSKRYAITATAERRQYRTADLGIPGDWGDSVTYYMRIRQDGTTYNVYSLDYDEKESKLRHNRFNCTNEPDEYHLNICMEATTEEEAMAMGMARWKRIIDEGLWGVNHFMPKCEHGHPGGGGGHFITETLR